MTRKDYQTWRLTCLSPVFAGSGDVWNPGQYLYDPQKETVFLLNEHPWIQFLYKEKVFPQFSQYVMDCMEQQRPASLFVWIRDHMIRKNSFRSMEEIISAMEKSGVIRKEEKVEIGLTRYGKKDSANEIHTFIRGAGGQYYVPGSTLKGAFRTAILSCAVRRHPEKYRSYWQDTLRASRKNDFERVGRELETAAAAPAEYRSKPAVAMLHSYFRGLSVSDARIMTEKMGVVQKWDWSDRAAFQNERPKSLPIYRECLVPGASLQFSVSVDPELMAPLDIRSAEDVLAAVREWTDEQYQLLNPVFGKNSQNLLEPMKKADLLLGGGTGFFNKILLYSLVPDRESAVRAARELMCDQFRRHHHDRDRILSPHTLKLTRWNNEMCLMGLCRLEALC